MCQWPLLLCGLILCLLFFRSVVNLCELLQREGGHQSAGLLRGSQASSARAHHNHRICQDWTRYLAQAHRYTNAHVTSLLLCWLYLPNPHFVSLHPSRHTFNKLKCKWPTWLKTGWGSHKYANDTCWQFFYLDLCISMIYSSKHSFSNILRLDEPTQSVFPPSPFHWLFLKSRRFEHQVGVASVLAVWDAHIKDFCSLWHHTDPLALIKHCPCLIRG